MIRCSSSPTDREPGAARDEPVNLPARERHASNAETGWPGYETAIAKCVDARGRSCQTEPPRSHGPKRGSMIEYSWEVKPDNGIWKAFREGVRVLYETAIAKCVGARGRSCQTEPPRSHGPKRGS